MTIRAVFENGVFRPTERVEFPDPCEVEIDVRQVKECPACQRSTTCTKSSAGVTRQVKTILQSVTTSISHECRVS